MKLFKTKTQEQKFWDFINNHIISISHVLDLNNYKINISEQKEYNGDPGFEINNDIYCVPASVSIFDRYLLVNIIIYDAFKEGYINNEYEKCVYTLIHELCHIILNEIYINISEAIDKNRLTFLKEQKTEFLTHWGSRLYNHYMDDMNINIKTGKPYAKRKK